MLNLQKEAQSLIKTGVEIFPVAVWSEMLNLKTLVDITHDSRNVFNTQFFPYLLDLLKKMSKRPCPGKLIYNLAILANHKDISYGKWSCIFATWTA